MRVNGCREYVVFIASKRENDINASDVKTLMTRPIKSSRKFSNERGRGGGEGVAKNFPEFRGDGTKQAPSRRRFDQTLHRMS